MNTKKSAILCLVLGTALWFSAASAASFEPADYLALDGLVANQFVGAPVQIASGDFVGTVTAESDTPDYTVAAVEIRLTNGGTMRIPASALRFNMHNGTLLTNLPASAFASPGYSPASATAY